MKLKSKKNPKALWHSKPQFKEECSEALTKTDSKKKKKKKKKNLKDSIKKKNNFFFFHFIIDFFSSSSVFFVLFLFSFFSLRYCLIFPFNNQA